MAWQGIEGHDEIARRLGLAESRGRLTGSYLFVGPDGVGKRTFALALARGAMCTAPRGPLTACGDCPSCHAFTGGGHPDLEVVSKPPDRSTIPLESLVGDQEHRMRDGLCWKILLRPSLGSRRVAVILDADALSEEAANCLLKTLEEPPDASIIIIVGTSLERQLPTIRSRCQVIRFGGLKPDTLKPLLTREHPELDEAAIAACLGAAGGSLSRAHDLVDTDVLAMRRTIVDHLSRQPIQVAQLARVVNAFVESAGKDAPIRRDRLRLVLGFAIEHLRDRLKRPERQGDQELTLSRLTATLDAFESIDRNANLAILCDAWASRLH